MDMTKMTEHIREGKVYIFYTSHSWQKKREEVFRLDRYECQKCKAKGKYSKAKVVHHVKHLKDRPDLALSIWETCPDGTNVRQLVSLCDACHEEEHPERLRQNKKKEPITEERW